MESSGRAGGWKPGNRKAAERDVEGAGSAADSADDGCGQRMNRRDFRGQTTDLELMMAQQLR